MFKQYSKIKTINLLIVKKKITRDLENSLAI